MENPLAYSPNPQAPSYPPQDHAGYPPEEQQPGNPQAPPPDFQQAGPGYPQQHAGGYPQQPAKDYAPAGYPPQGQGYVQLPGPSHMSSTNTTVVVAQPGVMQTAALPYFNDYMGLSFFSCLCCCWCIGFLAIMKSSEARSHYVVGDYTGALALADTARSLSIASIVCGIFVIPVIAMIFQLS